MFNLAKTMGCDLSICARLPLTPHPSLLVVDDDAAFLQVMPPTLVRAIPDAVIETCSSARDATSKLVDGTTDLAIADVTMRNLMALRCWPKPLRRGLARPFCS